MNIFILKLCNVLGMPHRRIFCTNVNYMLETVHCTLYAVYNDVLYTCTLFTLNCTLYYVCCTEGFSVHMVTYNWKLHTAIWIWSRGVFYTHVHIKFFNEIDKNLPPYCGIISSKWICFFSCIVPTYIYKYIYIFLLGLDWAV